MIRNTQVLWPALGAVLLGAALAGCGGNAPSENTVGTASTGTTVTTQATEGTTTQATAPAELAAFFPGATLSKKAFPMDADAASHLGKMGGVKFTGAEKEWEVYEASQNGARQGYAVMTHSDLPGGGDMHVAFAIDKSFKITKAKAVEAPEVAKMDAMLAQAVGKDHDAAFKVGKDFKASAGLAPGTAQIAVDALHRGVLILEENFNPNHGEHEHGEHEHGAAGHNDDGHKH